MTNLFVQEDFVNVTKGYRLGESDVYETDCETRGELYRAMQREYGRCTGRVYVDDSTGENPKVIGWVFQKRKRYDDSNETFLLETWVTVHAKPATKTISYSYA
jgi:hypothetical protein